MVALQLWIHSQPSQAGPQHPVSDFAPHGGLRPVSMWNLSSSAWTSLERQGQKHAEQEECYEFAPPGQRDLAIFKGYLRIKLFENTLSPPLYFRCLGWGPWVTWTAGLHHRHSPRRATLAPWLPHLGPTCPGIFYPKISVEPHRTHSMPSAWEVNAHSSRLIPFKAGLFTHKQHSQLYKWQERLWLSLCKAKFPGCKLQMDQYLRWLTETFAY